MNKCCLSFLLFFNSLSSFCLAEEKTLSQFEEVKSLIADLKKKLSTSSCDEEKSLIHFDLSVAYNKDQEIDMAFRHFLMALESAKLKSVYKANEREQSIYEEALKEYLTLAGSEPILAAKNLLERYGKVADENNDFLLLNFLISTAYANVGRYDDFFGRFYRAFPYLSDSFLAYKTQGILYLRLASRIRLEEERHHFQEEAMQYLNLALDRNPHDCSLYKILIFLAKEEENEALLSTYLHRICAHHVQIPRGDIYLYVREAISLGENELAQKIIDHANTLYESSRVITAAQDYLNQHKGT